MEIIRTMEKNNMGNQIEERSCEFKEECKKHSWMCFNEYVDVCSTRFVLKLSKALKSEKND